MWIKADYDTCAPLPSTFRTNLSMDTLLPIKFMALERMREKKGGCKGGREQERSNLLGGRSTFVFNCTEKISEAFLLLIRISFIYFLDSKYCELKFKYSKACILF